MSDVPFLDLGAAYNELQVELDSALKRVASSAHYIGGPEVETFEAEFAGYVGARYCVGVGNGHDALHLALRAVGVRPGDEVLIPAATFIATWLAVIHAGATPVPVDAVPTTGTLDPELLERTISAKTRAIVPVHLYGHPVDLDPVLRIAHKHGLAVVEDAAQAHGARYRDRRIGAHGDVVTWSFYPGKNLGAFGDAGAITTNSADIADAISELRNYGSKKKYEHTRIGMNSRLDPIQAAVLSVKLRHLESWNDRRKAVARRYLEAFADCDIELPKVEAWASPAWHLFVVRHRDRATFQKRLAQAGIQTLIHYPTPVHRQQAFAYMNVPEGRFPITEALHRDVLSLPMGPHLSESQIEAVVRAVIACCR